MTPYGGWAASACEARALSIAVKGRVDGEDSSSSGAGGRSRWLGERSAVHVTASIDR
jgi:hypothetical protein